MKKHNFKQSSELQKAKKNLHIKGSRSNIGHKEFWIHAQKQQKNIAQKPIYKSLLPTVLIFPCSSLSVISNESTFRDLFQIWIRVSLTHILITKFITILYKIVHKICGYLKTNLIPSLTHSK